MLNVIVLEGIGCHVCGLQWALGCCTVSSTRPQLGSLVSVSIYRSFSIPTAVAADLRSITAINRISIFLRFWS